MWCMWAHPVADPNISETLNLIGETAPPHLHMTCRRCGYKWLEKAFNGAATTGAADEARTID